jgi:hypothetical protein
MEVVVLRAKWRVQRVVVATMAALIAAAVGAVPQPTESAFAVGVVPMASSVSGTVFQDFNSNGEFDALVVAGQATDLGIAGITVSAYNAVGAQVGTTITAADGTYALAVTSTVGDPLRVEFEVPTSGPLAALRPSFAGIGNGTTIQFVNAGATGVDAAFNVPGEYCQANPHLAISRLCAGKGTLVDQSPTVFVSRYDGGPYDTTTALTNGFTSWASNRAADKSETGSLLGMAWDPTTRRVYNAAYVRRHAELYESGGNPIPGALFVTTPGGTRAGDPTGGTTAFVADLEALLPGDQFSNSNAAGPGYIPTNAARRLQCIEDQPTAPGCNDDDGVDSDILAGSVGVFEEVGSTGIGDIETDGQGNLYVVSLYDKHLYRVTLSANGLQATGMVSMGNIGSAVNCTNGQARPFSVRLWRGMLYLGVVCDGSGDFDPANPFALDNGNVSFTILTRNLEAAGTFTTFFGPQSLNGVVKGFTAANGGRDPESLRWNAWTNYYPPKASTAAMARFNQRPTPLLSEIEFDSDGSMILGFRDRTGDQTTTEGSETPSGGRTNYPAIASGDLYRLCRVGASWDTSAYKFEGTDPACPQGTDQGFAGNGVEYYYGDAWQTGHAEISAGMLLQVAGFPDLVFTAFDPYTGNSNGVITFYAGGIRYVSNATGGAIGYPNVGSGVMFYSTVGLPLDAGGFQKVNGMSDVEALCDAAPVQIGNRVWIDTNRDGIQDPGEVPVAGVTVRLYAADGVTLLGTAITNANGEYYFSSNVTEAAAGNHDEFGGGVVIGDAHVVRVDNPADYAPGGPLFGYELTSATQGTNTSIDSNATMVNDFPQISVPARAAGENDHTFDVGFNQLVGFGDFVWIDANANGVQDLGENPLAGVTVQLLDVNGDPVLDINGDPITAVTDATGYYFIDRLLPGDYRARFVLPPGYVFTVAGAAAATSGTDSNPDPTTGVTPVFTISDGPVGDTVANADPLVQAAFVNPTIDAGVVLLPPPPTTGGSSTGSVSVGDYVWWDTNGDGRQDATDVPLQGVVLRITTTDGGPVTDIFGNPVATTTTDSRGFYSFDNLPYGMYRVTVEPPPGFESTLANVGTTDKDSSTGFAVSRSLTTNGDRDPTLDFGFVANGVTIGNYVWVDANNNGIQDRGEAPVPGAVLTVTDMDGNPVRDLGGRLVGPQTTDAEGRYLFANLPAGQYRVTITYPPGYGPTVPGQGNGANDSASFVIVTGFLAAGQADLRLDFGVVPVVSVGDYVWWDTNSDGRQDATDVPLEGVVLTIFTLDGGPVYDSQGRLVTITLTDAKGWYTFDNLPLGQYMVCVTDPTGFSATLANVGSSDADSSTGCAVSRDLQVGGDRDPTLDFGYVSLDMRLPATGVGNEQTASVAALLLGMGLVAVLAADRRRRRLL